MSAEYDDLLSQMTTFRLKVVDVLTEMDLELMAVHMALDNGKPISKVRMQQFRADVQGERPMLEKRNLELLPPFRTPSQRSR